MDRWIDAWLDSQMDRWMDAPPQPRAQPEPQKVITSDGVLTCATRLWGHPQLQLLGGKMKLQAHWSMGTPWYTYNRNDFCFIPPISSTIEAGLLLDSSALFA